MLPRGPRRRRSASPTTTKPSASSSARAWTRKRGVVIDDEDRVHAPIVPSRRARSPTGLTRHLHALLVGMCAERRVPPPRGLIDLHRAVHRREAVGQATQAAARDAVGASDSVVCDLHGQLIVVPAVRTSSAGRARRTWRRSRALPTRRSRRLPRLPPENRSDVRSRPRRRPAIGRPATRRPRRVRPRVRIAGWIPRASSRSSASAALASSDASSMLCATAGSGIVARASSWQGEGRGSARPAAAGLRRADPARPASARIARGDDPRTRRANLALAGSGPRPCSRSFSTARRIALATEATRPGSSSRAAS